MWICKTCSCLVADQQIHCPDCIAHLNRESMLRHQKQFLGAIRRGQLELTLRPKDRHHHFMLIGDPRHAYCGEDLSDVRLRASSRRRLDDLPPDTCWDCRRVLNQLLSEEEEHATAETAEEIT